MSAVTIVQLYPDELGVAGDRGNVMAVRERLVRSGIAVTVTEHRVGMTLPNAADLIIVGNGPVSAMRNMHGDLLANGPAIRELVESGIPLFAYGSGAELLGHEVTLRDGTSLEGVGVLPFTAERTDQRKVGYVLTETRFGSVVGFEDNASVWHLDRAATALGAIIEGGGNGEGNAEGVISGVMIGTQVGGPVLPLNPLLTEALIGFMAERSAFDYAASPADADLDRYAERAREVITAHAKHVFSRI